MNPDDVSKTMRHRCLQTRQNLPLASQVVASAAVCARILTLTQYQTAKHIALYHAAKGEINLSKLRLLPGQVHCFPVMNADHTLSFFPTNTNTVFFKNRVGIFEPDVSREQAILAEQLDIIFLPVVAFDEFGTRLGMGGGYYDRTLAHHKKPLLAGVAYEFQRQPFIERQDWDIPMTTVITECSTYWSKP